MKSMCTNLKRASFENKGNTNAITEETAKYIANK